MRYADIALCQAKTQDCGYWFYNTDIDLQDSRDRHCIQLNVAA